MTSPARPCSPKTRHRPTAANGRGPAAGSTGCVERRRRPAAPSDGWSPRGAPPLRTSRVRAPAPPPAPAEASPPPRSLALSAVEGLALSAAEGLGLSAVEGLALSAVEGLALSAVEGRYTWAASVRPGFPG